MACEDYPTAATAKTFKLDAETTNEVVTLDQDRTSAASDGKTKKTFWGIENDATLQRENIDQLAEDQRDNLESTFTAQFAYKRIGNISLYAGNSLPEVDKLNSYQYPDDSGEWYSPIQDQLFPITIPADPSNDSGWALVNAASQDWVNENFIKSSQSTMTALSSTITAETFTTKSYSDGWQVTSGMPFGGSTFTSTGQVDLSKASTIEMCTLYDASGRAFAITNKKVSPQMLGGNDTDPSEVAFRNAINCGKPVFLEGDLRLGGGATLERNRLSVDMCGFEVTCSFPSASTIALDINGKKKTKIENGSVKFLTSGKFIFGKCKGLNVDFVDFVGGTLAIQVSGEYLDKSKDIYITKCTHDGSTPTLGSGGFFSADASDNVHITSCTGKDGGEFIDVNNLCSMWFITDCHSTNYKQNHWDVNSGWHITFSSCSVTSTISGLVSRPVWVSDHTMGSSWPTSAPDRLKNSNFVRFFDCTFIFENMDYTEAIIFNMGTEYDPVASEGRRLICKMVGCTIDCLGLLLDSTKFRFGVLDVIRWTITDNDLLGCGVQVMGEGKVNDNTFDALSSVTTGQAMDLTIVGGTCSDNSFYGWTGSPSQSQFGGVIISRNCERTTFAANEFNSEVDCAQVISSVGGGTNSYIENRYAMNVDPLLFGGVRVNPGDVVVYNGATS